MVDMNSIDFDANENSVLVGVIQAETGDVAFSMPPAMAAYRFQSLFTKEPETVRWISGFEPGGLKQEDGGNCNFRRLPK